MCRSATTLYGTCLEDWAIDWEDANYENATHFQDSCRTWSWEMSLLERDAVRRGALDETGALVAACKARNSAMRSNDAACETYTEIDWSEPPWSE